MGWLVKHKWSKELGVKFRYEREWPCFRTGSTRLHFSLSGTESCRFSHLSSSRWKSRGTVACPLMGVSLRDSTVGCSCGRVVSAYNSSQE